MLRNALLVVACLVTPIALMGGNCGPSTPPPSPPPTGACTPQECGPAPGMPNRLCSDGIHTSGPGACTRHTDGTCGFEILQCPATPAPQACGSRGLPACPGDSICVDNPASGCGQASDCPGFCVDPNSAPHCGGFVGTRCADGTVCVDDPTDDCIPAQGGADCGGLCVSAAGPSAT